MEAILDSSFILSAMRAKVDFLTALAAQGFKVKVPKEVIEELKDLRLKTNRGERTLIDLALEMIEKSNVRRVKLGKKKVDESLIEAGKRGAYIATLDGAIKRSVPNSISLSSATKDIVIERA